MTANGLARKLWNCCGQAIERGRLLRQLFVLPAQILDCVDD